MRSPAGALLALLVTLAAGIAGSTTAPYEIGTFSKAPAGLSVPPGWERWLPAPPDNLTRWKLVRLGGTTRLRALSSASGTGVVRRVQTNLSLTPLLAWQWRVLEHPSGADLATSGKDDAAARVCGLFGTSGESAGSSGVGGSLPVLAGQPEPAAALCYAWVAGSRTDAVLAVPSAPQVRTLIVETGSSSGMVDEVRDLVADFQRAFEASPGPLLAVALLTDSDATGSSASAYFGDLALMPR